MQQSQLRNVVDTAWLSANHAKGLASILDDIVMDIGVGEPIPEKQLESLYAITNALLKACQETADNLSASTPPTDKPNHHSELSERQKIDIRRRLDLSARCLGKESPKTITNDQGSPTREFLAYAKENSVSLDWLVCGDTTGLRSDLLDFVDKLDTRPTEQPKLVQG